MGSELVSTPADVMARATKMLQRSMLLQRLWFVCFFGGGVMIVVTAWRNKHLPAVCKGIVHRTGPLLAICASHPYHVWVIVTLVGVGGMLLTGFVTTRLAVEYFGEGARAFLRQGRSFVGPLGPLVRGKDPGQGR
jgi:hypothetical protein